jgi:hypothetical protein
MHATPTLWQNALQIVQFISYAHSNTLTSPPSPTSNGAVLTASSRPSGLTLQPDTQAFSASEELCTIASLSESQHTSRPSSDPDTTVQPLAVGMKANGRLCCVQV